ncbi:DNA recombination protein RmuC [Candidatus Legionella polyplacis]|nr:DNA recombination protein RmuC [Candidatus Legionella polyplacis]
MIYYLSNVHFKKMFFINIIEILLIMWIINYQFKQKFFIKKNLNKFKINIENQYKNIEINLQTVYCKIQKDIYEIITEKKINILNDINRIIKQETKNIFDQINYNFTQYTNLLSSNFHLINQEIHLNFKNLIQQVDYKLTNELNKNTPIFTNIMQQLTIIDEAQKKISKLSMNIINIQDILIDKKSRGLFGEIQLNTLIANTIPKNHYQTQYTLSNQKRADCILFMPEPNGHIVIDAKFPLETYKKLMNNNFSEIEKKNLKQQFKQDVQKHIKDIAEKYIVLNETTDSAIMFIPSESIFSEIHANYPEIINLSHRLRVWITSPTTLMAILTTARTILKDIDTKKQTHIIKKHLEILSYDFQRFEQRMDKLSKHINLACQDTNEIHISSKKISKRFKKIESVEIELTKK